MVNNIMGKKSLNPLPEAKSDEILAEYFVNFFLNKIKTIRERDFTTFCHMSQQKLTYQNVASSQP